LLDIPTTSIRLTMSYPGTKPAAGDPFANPPTSPDKPPALPDLPPVEAPSAGFVVQLFVIPAAVVVVVVIVWLLFGKLAGGERDAMEYVRQLRRPEANWRSAFELASLIQNDPAIAADPQLLGELTDLLSHELGRVEDPKHQEDPTLAKYLALTLGSFRTLEAQTQSGQIVDPIVPLARALGPKIDQSIRIAAAASLAKQAARLDGKLDDPRAIKALGEMASDENPQVRQVAVYALGFFGGPQSDQVLRDRVRSDEDRFTRYNAAVALGRRGDPAAESTLREMLSTADLDKVVRVDPNTEEKNTAAARQNSIEVIQLEALQALRDSLRNPSHQLAPSLRPQVEKLTTSGLISVRNQATELLRELGEGQ
jgi:HEAT repeat protein